MRFFDYYAKRMAEAVEQAADSLVPVRIGASVSTFDKTHRHSFGPAVADDGTPAGYPQRGHRPRPHRGAVRRRVGPGPPEAAREPRQLQPAPRDPERQRPDLRRLRGADAAHGRPRDRRAHDLHAERGRHRRARAQHLPLDARAARVHPPRVRAGRVRRAPDERRDRRHVARRRAPDARALRQVRAVPEPAGGRDGGPLVPRARLAPLPRRLELPRRQGVRAATRSSRSSAFPTARTPAAACRALADIFGLDGPPDPPRAPVDPGISTDDFQALGIPLPENYSAPSYTGLAEDVSIHLQAFRLGDILFTVCSCEQWFDQSRNIKTRTDKVQGNEHLGYDWAARCSYNGDRPARGPARTRGTRRPTCRRSRPRTSCG